MLHVHDERSGRGRVEQMLERGPLRHERGDDGIQSSRVSLAGLRIVEEECDAAARLSLTQRRAEEAGARRCATDDLEVAPYETCWRHGSRMAMPAY